MRAYRGMNRRGFHAGNMYTQRSTLPSIFDRRWTTGILLPPLQPRRHRRTRRSRMLQCGHRIERQCGGACNFPRRIRARQPLLLLLQ